MSTRQASSVNRPSSLKGNKRRRQCDDKDYDSDAPLIQILNQKRAKETTTQCIQKVDRILVRRTPEFFVQIVKGLNKKQLAAVHEMGFGSLVHFSMTDVPGRIAYLLLSKFEPVTCSIELSDSRRLHISEEDVHLTFGFPRGEMMIERKTRQNNVCLLDEISEGTGNGRYNMLINDVQNKMEKDKDGGEWFKKLFLILMEHALIQGTADGYVKPKILDFIDNVTNVRNYNWCAYLLSILI